MSEGRARHGRARSTGSTSPARTKPATERSATAPWGRSGGRDERRTSYGATIMDSVTSMAPGPSSSGSTHEVAWTTPG